MITETASGTVVAEKPEQARNVLLLIGVPTAVVGVVLLGFGIVELASGQAAGILLVLVGGFFLLVGRLGFVHYEVTVSDRSVRLRRRLGLLVRPLDLELDRADVHGYRISMYRGMRFGLVGASGQRLGPTVRSWAMPGPELEQVMERYGIPLLAPKASPAT